MYISMGVMMWQAPAPALLADSSFAMGAAQLILALVVMGINRKFFVNGFFGLLHKAPNMDTLVALGSGAAFVYSSGALFFGREDFYFESAAMIVTLITVGKLLEAKAKGKTTSALKGLMALAPAEAVLFLGEEEKRVPIGAVKVGDVLLVRPGEALPVDGVVLEGESAVNEAALTGESIPVDKVVGAKVYAATINQSGILKICATGVGEDTALSKIIAGVNDAAATKAPIAKLADTVAGIFVPCVMGIALVTLAAWILAGQSLGFALARAISVLVISCPCALGLATPVAIMVGSGVGAKKGILFKNATALEVAGKIDIVALDKTGTITLGNPGVVEVLPAKGVTKEELVSLAAALEHYSEHPLAKAVCGYAKEQNLCWQTESALEEGALSKGQELEALGADSPSRMEIAQKFATQGQETQIAPTMEITNFRALPGHGLQAELAGEVLLGGSLSFIKEKIALPLDLEQAARSMAERGLTPLLFAYGEKLLGILAVADQIKPEAKTAVNQMKAMGLRVVMLTGDNEKTAAQIAALAGIEEVIAEVLPKEKEAVILRLQKEGKVAMVGDGINDAVALTSADIGIAIGAGTDIAMDAANVVLLKSALTDVPTALSLSRATLRIIRQNLFWAFFYNCLGIPLAAGVFIPLLGWELNPMFGAAAMSLSSFCVVSNALRLNLFKD